jgi:hypothetical protein
VCQDLNILFTFWLYPFLASGSAYTEYSAGWLSKATARNDDLLRDVLSVTHSDNDTDIMNFTMGKGPKKAPCRVWLIQRFE